MHKETFWLKDKEIADIYYRRDKDQEIAPFKYLPNKYAELIDFFGVQPPKIKLNFIYSRSEMDKHWGSKSTVSAMVDNKDPYLIYFFSPLVFEKITKLKINEILPIIVHEAAHTFVTEINGRCFSWINEGVCEFASEVVYKEKIERKNWEWFRHNNVFIDTEIGWGDLIDHQGYNISSRLASYIIKRCGKNTVFDLLRIKRVPDKDIKNKMSRILGSNFDTFLDDFEETINDEIVG